MVEGARLESVYTGNRIAGSNPALSAKKPMQVHGFFYFKVCLRAGGSKPRHEYPALSVVGAKPENGKSIANWPKILRPPRGLHK